MLNENDKELLQKKGISEEQITEQLQQFKKGFPYLKIDKAATINDGIMQVDAEDLQFYLQEWEDYLQHKQARVVKFVPASGAASRMFKDLFEFMDAEYTAPQTAFEKKFFDNIHLFAFYKELDAACRRNTGLMIDGLKEAGQYEDIIANLLLKDGLNYGFLPKGLLLFHQYDDGARTPMEEHLTEGALYAQSATGGINVHFTVSEEHREFFEQLLAEKREKYEKKFITNYNVGFSEQKSSTDTIAADAQNEPFRENGQLFFRPGGHGALIENLNDISADIVFIKNVDNVVPDKLKEATVTYKKLLAGVLVNAQEQIFSYLEILESGELLDEELDEIVDFIEEYLNVYNDNLSELDYPELIDYLYLKLNRPIRVCGMVKNEGEPGGGPFFAENEDGTISLQILESSQIDTSKEEGRELLQQSTHFNPVDLVCAVKDYRGNKFNLTDFVDKNTGFISLKSKNGKELKALELPGLWNGAMSDWNTIFVEVPIETFNPVKTVNDLLRPEHQ